MASLVLTLVGSLLVGASLTYTNAHKRNAQARVDSEAALLLAEAGITNEIQRINSLYGHSPANAASRPTTESGAPFKGRTGTADGVPGTFWVYASTTPQGNTPWPGHGPLYITANAIVNGAHRTATIGGSNMGVSLFADFALFGNSPSTSGGSVAFGMTGSNNVVNIEGAVGTNGGVRGSSYTMNYTMAVNYMKTNGRLGSFTGADAYSTDQAMVLPTVAEVGQTLFGYGSGTTLSTYLATNNHNETRIRQWASGARTGEMVSPSNTTAANLGRVTSLINKQGNRLGLWEGLNLRPGTTSTRTLILPPGDYFFDSADLRWNADTELLVDNAGLSVGGNPNRQQVRIWILGSGSSDQIQIPIKVTDPADASTFRLYYGKAGARLTLERQSSMSGVLEITGCVYAVNKKVTATTGDMTQVDLFGDPSQARLMVIKGSVMADQVTFNGYVDIIHPGTAILSPWDPLSGVGFSGEHYSD